MFLYSEPFDLFVDEAQYWLWSTTPDWGYYSKPPVISWLIWLTTHLFSSTETWFVRIGSPLCHLATAVLIYRIASLLSDKQTAIWSSLTFATLPAITLSSMIISTDPPLLLIWSLALYCFIRSVRSHSYQWWVWLGVALGIGSLTKYHIALFYPSAIAYLILSPQIGRNQISYLAKGLSLAWFINALIYLPNLLWNATHNFVSYAHTKDIAKLHESLIHLDHAATFIMSQFGVIGPILGIILIVAFIRSLRSVAMRDDLTSFLFSFTMIFLGAFVMLSLLSNAKANWAAPAYITGTIWVVHTAFSLRWQRLLHLSLALHLLLACVFYGYLAFSKFDYRHPVIYKPLERVQGWKNLGDAVSSHLKNYPHATILTTERKTAAALSYYTTPRPAPVVKWNPDGHVDDHFDLLYDFNQHTHKPTILVTTYDPKDITDYFYMALPLGTYDIPLSTGKARRYSVYYLEGFKQHRLP